MKIRSEAHEVMGRKDPHDDHAGPQGSDYAFTTAT